MSATDHLYVLHTPDTLFLKVGRSQNPGARASQLSSAHPTGLVRTMHGEGCGWLEPIIHLAFSSECLGNEWYQWDGRLAAMIDDLIALDEGHVTAGDVLRALAAIMDERAAGDVVDEVDADAA